MAPSHPSAEEKEALSAGRAFLWIRNNWQFLALAGLLGGPNLMDRGGKPEAVHPPMTASQAERLVAVETRLTTLTEQMRDVNWKLDRLLTRRGDRTQADSDREMAELSRTAQALP